MNHDRLLALVLSAVALGCGKEGEACIDLPADGICPAAEDVDLDEAYPWLSCDGEKVLSVSGEGRVKGVSQAGGVSGCCYDAVLRETTPVGNCVVGRPLREDHADVLADLVPRADWGGARGTATDAERALAWAKAGAAEHASIPAFSKLALELLAHGAPAALIRAVHQAGLDEIDHAERCFALAGRFGGEPVGPGAFPFGQPIVPNRALADIAADAVREGCLGETLGAVLARAAADAATEADVREALAAIATDEERHAALSWQLVGWAVRVGGSEVRTAVRAAFAGPPVTADADELAVRAGVAPAVLRAAAGAGWRRVVGPAARALLAA